MTWVTSEAFVTHTELLDMSCGSESLQDARLPPGKTFKNNNIVVRVGFYDPHKQTAKVYIYKKKRARATAGTCQVQELNVRLKEIRSD